MTQIGALDKRITLQCQTKTPDGMGGFTVAWVAVCTAWAGVWPVSATEQLRASAPTMVATHRVRIWYRSVLSASWRVLYNGRYFSIVSKVDPSESHEYIDLLCKEVTA